jgi:tRNA threonylcarbamoyl adenosine modification protein YeaZ
MKILALEFSTAQRSVAVVQGGATGTQSASEVIETGTRASRTVEMIDDALKEAKLEREQIDCLAVGIGPGSYVGIRSAISLAQGWQLVRPIKLLAVSTVECLAAQAQGEGWFGRVDVIVDAQRGEFYQAGYELTPDSRREVSPLRLASRAEVEASNAAILTGPDITRWFANGRILIPRAAMIGQLAWGRTDFIAGEEMTPIYLREISFVKAPPARIID